jgi:hypothetical protein
MPEVVRSMVVMGKSCTWSSCKKFKVSLWIRPQKPDNRCVREDQVKDFQHNRLAYVLILNH